jgi:hypothetical protein
VTSALVSELAAGLSELPAVNAVVAEDVHAGRNRTPGARSLSVPAGFVSGVGDDHGDGRYRYRHHGHHHGRRDRIQPHHSPGQDEQGQAEGHQSEVNPIPHRHPLPGIALVTRFQNAGIGHQRLLRAGV